ncbi:hypothetical protein P8452_36248 [Trifolium repens]|nr:hypothetical protein P8452_36248 [Trifolium repens]
MDVAAGILGFEAEIAQNKGGGGHWIVHAGYRCYVKQQGRWFMWFLTSSLPLHWWDFLFCSWFILCHILHFCHFLHGLVFCNTVTYVSIIISFMLGVKIKLFGRFKKLSVEVKRNVEILMSKHLSKHLHA